MALSWDKEMFDKNHDGKLTGSENTNWEIFWFGLGLGFGDKEDDEIYIAPKLIPDKKAAEIIRIIDKAYDQYRLGFSSQSHFGKCFRVEMGVTPGNYNTVSELYVLAGKRENHHAGRTHQPA